MFRHRFKQLLNCDIQNFSFRFREIAGALEEALSDTLEEAPGKLLLQTIFIVKELVV